MTLFPHILRGVNIIFLQYTQGFYFKSICFEKKSRHVCKPLPPPRCHIDVFLAETYLSLPLLKLVDYPNYN